MRQGLKRPQWLDYLLLFLLPVVGMALGVAVTIVLHLDQTDYGNLIINLFFLAACIVLIRSFKFSSEALGVKVIKEKMNWHVLISLTIFVLYILFYIFVIRISVLKPFSRSNASGRCAVSAMARQ